MNSTRSIYVCDSEAYKGSRPLSKCGTPAPPGERSNPASSWDPVSRLFCKVPGPPPSPTDLSVVRRFHQLSMGAFLLREATPPPPPGVLKKDPGPWRQDLRRNAYIWRVSKVHGSNSFLLQIPHFLQQVSPLPLLQDPGTASRTVTRVATQYLASSRLNGMLGFSAASCNNVRPGPNGRISGFAVCTLDSRDLCAFPCHSFWWVFFLVICVV